MSRLRDGLSSPESKARYVRRLFATIADRYDFITVFLSFGRDRAWKRRVVELSAARAGMDALDLASGTGDIAFEVARRGARVTALDITPRMLELARAKAPQLAAFVVGDMIALPFAGARFDLVTTGYGLRNVPELTPAIDEIHRVLRSGGVLVSLDFNRPANPLVRAVYLTYLTIVGSALGYALHRNPDTYRYIPESIRRYPGANGVSALLEARGFSGARVIPLLGGLMAINIARKG
jgi:demethylmenaquinone methyltransferase / 2-methoxy-6-polyprenyl-1,4-benzoquinol methylase